jgi:hypothetical protein
MALRFRFTDEQDVAAYGEGWWVWDRDALTRLPGRDLIAIEDEIDRPFREIQRLQLIGSTLGMMAAMWIALRQAGFSVGAWADFNPVVHTAVWEAAPEVPLASGGDPAQGSASSTTPSTESASS